jgi:hypothetical protein
VRPHGRLLRGGETAPWSPPSRTAPSVHRRRSRPASAHRRSCLIQGAWRRRLARDPPRAWGIPAVGEPPRVCACCRRPSWHEREGPELTMAINANSELRSRRAGPARPISPFGGQRASRPGDRRAAHTASGGDSTGPRV